MPPQRRTAAVAAVAVIVVGLVVCVVWVLGVPDTTLMVPASSPVQFVTGLSFVLGGTGLLLALGDHPLRALAAITPLLLLAAAMLLEYVLGRDLAVDTLFTVGGALPYPGRMAPNTAVAMLLAASGLAALLAGHSRIWALSIATMLAALATALAAVAILGYAFDLTAAFEWAGLTRMALLTAVTLVVLGVGIILAAREIGRIASWIEQPWLASSVGIGAAGLGLLATHALAVEVPGLAGGFSDGLHAAAIVFAILLAGTVAQGRHMRLLAQRLSAALRFQAEQEQALRDSEHRLQVLIDNVPTAVVVHAADSSIEFANPSAAALLGLTRDQILGRRAIDPAWRFVREDGSPMPVDEYPVNRVIGSGQPLRDYVVGIHVGVDEPVRWGLVDAVPSFGRDGRLRQVIVSFIDISERQQEKLRLAQLASTDTLTGLGTRRRLIEQADHELARARRGGGPLALILFDIDHFKAINDRFGHEAGDRVLQRIAELLRSTLREVDLAARWGGEEFCVLLPDTPLSAAIEIGERLRAAVEALPLRAPDGRPLPVTASFGVTVSRPEDDDIHRLVDAADQAMYRAKREGRNRVCMASAAPPVAADGPVGTGGSAEDGGDAGPGMP